MKSKRESSPRAQGPRAMGHGYMGTWDMGVPCHAMPCHQSVIAAMTFTSSLDASDPLSEPSSVHIYRSHSFFTYSSGVPPSTTLILVSTS